MYSNPKRKQVSVGTFHIPRPICAKFGAADTYNSIKHLREFSWKNLYNRNHSLFWRVNKILSTISTFFFRLVQKLGTDVLTKLCLAIVDFCGNRRGGSQPQFTCRHKWVYIHTSHIYFPVWLKTGIRGLARTLFNNKWTFHERRHTQGWFSLWTLIILRIHLLVNKETLRYF
jgi:hypothetical protein